MVIFDSAAIYIDNLGGYTTVQDKWKARIAALDAIIDALEISALSAAGRSHLTEYTLNDGQTQIKCMYRSAADIQQAIMDYEGMKNYYINKLNGRVFRLMDSKNFIPNRRGRF